MASLHQISNTVWDVHIFLMLKGAHDCGYRSNEIEIALKTPACQVLF